MPIVLAVVLLVAVAALAGCGGGAAAPESEAPTSTAEAPPPAEPEETTTVEPEETTTAEPEPPKPKPLPGLPRYTAGYDGWTKLNARPIPPRASDPHNGTKNVFVSTDVGGDGLFPNGAIVVKEAVRPGADFIGLIAVMRKRAGVDPDHNDWVFVEWVRDGPDERFREIASGAVCWSCHAGAADRDYVFTLPR